MDLLKSCVIYGSKISAIGELLNCDITGNEMADELARISLNIFDRMNGIRPPLACFLIKIREFIVDKTNQTCNNKTDCKISRASPKQS